MRPASLAQVAAVAAAALLALVASSLLLVPLGSPAVVGVQLCAFATPALVFARQHGGARVALGLAPPPGRAVLGAALIGLSSWILVLALLAPLLSHLPDRSATEEALSPLASPGIPLAVRLLLFALVPAVCEELLCRGVIARHLAPRLGAVAAVVVSAGFFGLLHGTLSQGLPAMTFGVLLAIAALASGSTWTSMVAHLGNNAAVILVAAPELSLGDHMADAGPGLVVAAAAATAVGLVLVRAPSGTSAGTLP